MNIRTGNANCCVLPDTQRVADDSGAVHYYPVMVEITIPGPMCAPN